jgi:hypothetical protein
METWIVEYQGLVTWGFNDASEHPLCTTANQIIGKHDSFIKHTPWYN